MRVERSATIDQLVDRVFDQVSTPDNDPTWVPASLRHEMLSPAPMRVGSITEEDVWFLGRRMRYVWEITHYEPPTAFALRSISGPIPATIRVLLRRGLDRGAHHRRDHPGNAGADGGTLGASQEVDCFPRSRVRSKKGGASD